jgi:hypothetical protein
MKEKSGGNVVNRRRAIAVAAGVVACLLVVGVLLTGGRSQRPAEPPQTAAIADMPPAKAIEQGPEPAAPAPQEQPRAEVSCTGVVRAAISPPAEAAESEPPAQRPLADVPGARNIRSDVLSLIERSEEYASLVAEGYQPYIANGTGDVGYIHLGKSVEGDPWRRARVRVNLGRGPKAGVYWVEVSDSSRGHSSRIKEYRLDKPPGIGTSPATTDDEDPAGF